MPSGMTRGFFRHKLNFDRSSMTRWRQRMGEEKLKALLQESLAAAVKTEALKPSGLTAVVVDTTVMPKNVMFPKNAMFPADAKLLNRARERPVRLAKKHGAALRQSYARAGNPRVEPEDMACAHQTSALCPCQAVQARG
jgi:transposase, IS5 family